MRYVLLLLTILTAGFSVWYYQHHISPEGKELAARKTAMEQEAVVLEKTVSQTRKKLDEAQDATRTAEEAMEKFQETYLEQKRPNGNWPRTGRMPEPKRNFQEPLPRRRTSRNFNRK